MGRISVGHVNFQIHMATAHFFERDKRGSDVVDLTRDEDARPMVAGVNIHTCEFIGFFGCVRILITGNVDDPLR